MLPRSRGLTGLELAFMVSRRRAIAPRSRSLALTSAVNGSRARPVVPSTAFCLAVPLSPRNSVTSSRTVRIRPRSVSWAM